MVRENGMIRNWAGEIREKLGEGEESAIPESSTEWFPVFLVGRFALCR